MKRYELLDNGIYLENDDGDYIEYNGGMTTIDRYNKLSISRQPEVGYIKKKGLKRKKRKKKRLTTCNDNDLIRDIKSMQSRLLRRDKYKLDRDLDKIYYLLPYKKQNIIYYDTKRYSEVKSLIDELGKEVGIDMHRVIKTKICFSFKRHPEKYLYYYNVWMITESNDLSVLSDFDKRGKGYALDHIFPISKGYIGGVSPLIVGCIDNLQMMPYRDNLRKSNKVSKEDAKKYNIT